jgi:hypothetical protein
VIIGMRRTVSTSPGYVAFSLGCNNRVLQCPGFGTVKVLVCRYFNVDWTASCLGLVLSNTWRDEKNRQGLRLYLKTVERDDGVSILRPRFTTRWQVRAESRSAVQMLQRVLNTGRR